MWRNHSIVENSKNTEKSPEDLRRLAVTQTLVKKKKTPANTGVKNFQRSKITRYTDNIKLFVKNGKKLVNLTQKKK